MIPTIDETGEDTVGFRVSGTVTAKDYEALEWAETGEAAEAGRRST